MRQAVSTWFVLFGLIWVFWVVFFGGMTSKAYALEAGNTDLKRFLPNNSNSVYNAKGLLRKWPAEGPKELWRVEIGFGKTAVVEADGRAYTGTETDMQQYALCIDPLTGKTLWKVLLFPKANRHNVNGPVTTPVIDGDRIYFIPYAIYNDDVWEMRCPIICLNSEGKELWRDDETFWATEGSVPLVEGDTLYVSVDNPEHAMLVALDKMTGESKWVLNVPSNSRRELGAPSSLTYQVVDGIPQVIVATFGTREILGVHADSGEIMWRFPYPAPIILGLISTPVAVDSRLFVCGNEGRGRCFSACLEMEAIDGKINFKEIYSSTELQVNNYNTPAIYDDAVFGFGGRGDDSFIHCTELSDGSLLWQQIDGEWSKDQQLIIADGLIFALTKNEELVMAEASREAYNELGRFKLNMELGIPQQPTIANGRMYIRGIDSVVCYQIIDSEAK